MGRPSLGRYPQLRTSPLPATRMEAGTSGGYSLRARTAPRSLTLCDFVSHPLLGTISVWRCQSQPNPRTRTPRVSPETIALIQNIARANRSWGAERIRGELLKLDIRVAKWTIQKYMRHACPSRPSGQTWATFLHNHASDTGACDLLPVTDLLFRPLHAFFIVELASRQVQHVGVTRHPPAVWLAQQLREATPFGQHPTYLMRDNDSK